MERPESLVQAGWLGDHANDPGLVIADVRWYLPTTGRSGRHEYETAHVPGALFVDLDRDLAAHGGPGLGRHPLPTPEAFASTLGAHGIRPGDLVVAYDDSGGSTAARLWWMLRQVGHEHVAILDGGIRAWEVAGLPLEAGPVPPRAPREYPPAAFGSFGPIVRRDEVLPEIAAGAILLDARAPERFEGRVEPVDPRAGHVPGARNAPFSGNLETDASGVPRFRSTGALRQRFEATGAEVGARVILSCGSGVTACHNAFAMHLAGFQPAGVYVGSWSDWASTDGLPVETGAGRAGPG